MITGARQYQRSARLCNGTQRNAMNDSSRAKKKLQVVRLPYHWKPRPAQDGENQMMKLHVHGNEGPAPTFRHGCRNDADR